MTKHYLRGFEDVDLAKMEKTLTTHDNGRQRCSVCKDTIPADKYRLSLSYNHHSYGGGAKRVCEDCILGFAVMLTRTPRD